MRLLTSFGRASRLVVLIAAGVVLAGNSLYGQAHYAAGRLTPAHRVTVKPLDLESVPAEEDLITAGQLGGPLFPTHELKDKKRDQGARSEFGKAIEAWNRHQYPRAVAMFRQYLRDFPDSPWAAEADLHIGCDATYNGRYTEADSIFNSLILKFQGKEHPGARMLANKARQRLAVLRVEENRLDEAGLLFQGLLQDGPDWRQRTYASHWLQRLSRFRGAGQGLFNCGAEALAYVLEKQGNPIAAGLVRTNAPRTISGHTLLDLVSLAASQNCQLTAVETPPADVGALPLPAILHIAPQTAESGHYWVLDKVQGEELELLEPQSHRRFHQTRSELAREWDGRALVIARSGAVPGRKLRASELEASSGGCCGAPRPEDRLGKPRRGPGGGGYDPNSWNPCSSGAPTWEVNMLNMNLFITDTPLWYDPPFGPPVRVTLSYNSQSAIAQHEPFGNKWQFNYGSYLIVDTSGMVIIFMPDGRRDVFMPDGTGGYRRPYGIFNRLTKLGPNQFELRFPDDSVFVYEIPAGTSSQQPFLTTIRDATGQRLSLGYDSRVNLTTITDAQGKVFTLTYSSQDLITSVADPFGRRAQFEYDSAKNLIRITDMGGYWSSLAYDGNVYCTSLSDERGTTQFRIEPADAFSSNSDEYPRPGDTMYANYRVTVTNPAGGMEEFFYYGGCDIDGYGSCSGYSWHVSPRDYVPWASRDMNNYRSRAPKTRYLFTNRSSGQQGEISEVILPAGDRLQYDYDMLGNLTGVTDAHGHAYRYTVNWLGNITSATDPKDHLLSFAYAANGLDLTTISDSLGAVALTYDNQHHTISIKDRLNQVTSMSYSSYGQLTSSVNPGGVTDTYVYDSSQRLSSVTRNGQTLQAFTRDAIGRVTQLTTASGLVVRFQYNDLNEVVRVTYPDGKFEAFTYSSCCPRLIDSITDRSGRLLQFTYDSLKRVVEILNTQRGSIRARYDANGNLVSLTDANGNTTAFLYDLNNRFVGKTFADGKSLRFGFDEAGLLTSRTNPSGTVVSYSYDANHNLTGIGYSDTTPGVVNTYDGFNRLVRVDDGSGTTAYAWDANSRLVSVDGPWSNDTISLSYNALDQVTTLGVQSGQTSSYSFDAFDRLNSLQSGIGSYTWSYYGPSPLIQSLARPNGSYTTNGYDLLNRQTLLSNRRSSGQVINEYSYVYDAQGQCVSESAINTPSAAFGQNSQVSYSYSSANQLTSSTPPDRLFASDDDGNLVRGYTPEGYVFSAAFDAEDRLKSITYTNAAQVIYRTDFTYKYNHLLARRRDYANGALLRETRYVRLGSLPVQERDGANAVAREYLWAGTREGGIGELLRVRQGGQDYDCLYNANGSVVGLLDSAGSQAAAYDYTPFGLPLARTGAVDQPMRFSTKAYDEATGLLYYGYRFYVPVLGRWLTRDPMGESKGLNPYQFVADNPLGNVDPLGLWELKLEAYAVVGGAVSIGQNPNGSWFVGAKGGYGTGLGVSMNPVGSMPGYQSDAPCQVSIGFFGSAGLGKYGPLGASASAREGVNISSSSDHLLNITHYSKPPYLSPSVSPKDGGFSLGGSISYGVEAYVSF